MTTAESTTGSTWDTLKRRKLVQWALAYAAGAWVVLQVVSLVAGAYAWPAIVLRLATGVVLAGFPIALVLAWYHGERGEQKVGGMELAILTVLLLLGGGALWLVERNAGAPAPAPSVAASAPAAATAAPASPLAAIPRKSIAVLPFTDMSPAKDQEYFSDGMAEELLNALAKVKDLKVAGRTSSFSFKGRNEDLRTVGKVLAVAHVLEGSVRKQGDKVRITAQLIQAEDGYHLWSETYDGDLSDVFELQERIARAITEQLKVVLDGGQQQRLVPVATVNAEAYALYLQATGIFNRRDGKRFPDAIAQLQRAIGLDPQFARAHARLASVAAVAPIYMSSPPGVDMVVEHARRASELATGLGEPHAALGQSLQLQLRYEQARAEYEQALALEPDDVTANFWYAIHLTQAGYTARGNTLLDRVLMLDPMLPNALFWRGTQLAFAGDIANADRLLQRAVDAKLAFAGAGTSLVAAARGQRQDAMAQLASGLEALQVGLGEEAAALLARGVYGSPEDRATAIAWIDRQIGEQSKPVNGVTLRVLLLMGESGRVLALGASPRITNVAPFVPLLWSDHGKAARRSPEFSGFARKFGLAEAWDRYGEPDQCKRRAPGDYVCD